MKAHMSVYHAINIPDGSPDHEMPRRNQIRYPKESYDGDAPLPQTITTCKNLHHPRGQRGFTIREVACLLGFPIDDQFAGNYRDRKTQIGNAVPPPISEAILRQCIKAMMETDGLPPSGTSILLCIYLSPL